MDDPKDIVTIIILNYNKKSEALSCLQSVMKLDYSPFEVVFVDNGSTDGSVDAVREAFPTVLLVRNSSNLGVSAGRNVGWRHANSKFKAAYVLFLDNDTVVDPFFLRRLVDGIHRDPKARVACGKAYTEYPSDRIMSTGITVNLYTGVICDRGSGEKEKGQYNQPVCVDACGGFGIMIESNVYSQLAGFDERYSPYGWEDVDFCLRVRNLGYRTRYVPDAVIYHKGTQLGRGRIPSYERHKIRNYFILIRQHCNFSQWFSCAICVPIRGIILVGRMLLLGRFDVVAAQMKGFWESVRGRVDSSN